MDKVRTEAAEKGDLGLVAESSKTRQRMMFRPAPLTVAGVFKTLKDIAMMSGHAVSGGGGGVRGVGGKMPSVDVLDGAVMLHWV